MERIEKMLRETIGLDAASVGSGSIQRVIRLRMKNLGAADPASYREILSRSRTEWDQLVEGVVVTETWFFRDAEAFNVVVEAARAALPDSTLRVLTIPCSSGEEPYSLAIALAEAGISPGRVEIEAVDISSRALARAKSGVYSRNSFRGKNLTFRDRYFTSAKDGFVLQPEICNSVKFIEGNVLNPDFAPDEQKYDFIFCRNLLIYFDRPTQQKALEKLHTLLASNGLLFVGPAEQPLTLEHGFVSANLAKAFACRKSISKLRTEQMAKEAWKTPSPLPVSFSRSDQIAPSPTAVVAIPHEATRESEKTAITPELELARQLADAGRLQDAAEICERYLGSDSDSAQGWYLLGLIRDATGNPNAMDCYRKALYLKPDHYETLLQMAMWLQKNGESARARTFKARAERAKRQPGETKAEANNAQYS